MSISPALSSLPAIHGETCMFRVDGIVLSRKMNPPSRLLGWMKGAALLSLLFLLSACASMDPNSSVFMTLQTQGGLVRAGNQNGTPTIVQMARNRTAPLPLRNGEVVWSRSNGSVAHFVFRGQYRNCGSQFLLATTDGYSVDWNMVGPCDTNLVVGATTRGVLFMNRENNTIWSYPEHAGPNTMPNAGFADAPNIAADIPNYVVMRSQFDSGNVLTARRLPPGMRQPPTMNPAAMNAGVTPNMRGPVTGRPNAPMPNMGPSRQTVTNMNTVNLPARASSNVGRQIEMLDSPGAVERATIDLR